MGLELVPELPPLPDITFLLSVEADAAFGELTRSGGDDLMVHQIRSACGPTYSELPVSYQRWSTFRPTACVRSLSQKWTRFFKKVDVYLYLAPSWATSSLAITNLTGHPAVVLPNGFRNGTPTSITFTGKLFGEAELMALALFYQEITGWQKVDPGG